MINLIQKFIYLFLTVLTLTCGCVNKNNNEQTIASNKVLSTDDNEWLQKFVSNNFLEIVDTTAYHKGAFVCSPSEKNKNYSKLSVFLNPIIGFKEQYDTIDIELIKANKKEFEELFSNGKYADFVLNNRFPKQIGKYHIFLDSKYIREDLKYAGRIDINNLKIHKDNATLILSESIEKVGTTYLVLLKKKNNSWKVYQKEVLSRS